MNFYNEFSRKSGIGIKHLQETKSLLEAGNTIPFLSRYRKEATGGMDEVLLEEFRDSIENENKFNERKESILKSLKENDFLTSDLQNELDACLTLTELEDV